MSEPVNELRQAAERLVGVANGMAGRYGAWPAAHLLMSTAIGLAIQNMTKADVVAWLRIAARNLEADEPEVAH